MRDLYIKGIERTSREVCIEVYPSELIEKIYDVFEIPHSAHLSKDGESMFVEYECYAGSHSFFTKDPIESTEIQRNALKGLKIIEQAHLDLQLENNKK